MGGVGKVRGAWGQASFSALYARYLPKACVPTMAITHPIANQGFLFFFSFGGLPRTYVGTNNGENRQ